MSDQSKSIFTLNQLSSDIEENDTVEDFLLLITKNRNNDTNLPDDVLFIEEVVRLGFEPKNEKEPFRPFMVTAESSTLAIENINLEQYKLIEEFRNKVNCHQIKAKLSDVLWVGNQSYENVEIALKEYILFIGYFLENKKDKSNLLIRNELRRCTSLYRLVKDKEEVKNSLLNIFENLILPSEPEPRDYIRFIFFKVFAYSKLKTNEKIITDSKKYAKESKAQSNFRKTRDYLNICLELYKKDKDIANRDKILDETCEIYLEEINVMKESGANGLVLTDICSRALHANMMTHKITRSRKDAIDDIHAELNNASLISQQEMKSVPYNFDLSKPIEETSEALEELSTIDGILYLAQKTIPNELSYYFDHAEKTLKNSIHHLFSSIHYDENGRIVDRDNGLSFEDEDENTSIILSEALNLFKNNVLVKGTCIDHGRNTLLLKHDFKEYDFDEYLINNPFIPKSRINIIRKALWYGYLGKWEESMHLLVPQIENCIRHFSESVGVIVTLVDEDIIQQERTLGPLLNLSEVKRIFGEEHLFQIKALLSESKGFNFRNRLSHGLIGDDFYNSCSYFPPFVWANFIYLTCMLRETFFKKLNNEK
jgi:hypothetical protein